MIKIVIKPPTTDDEWCVISGSVYVDTVCRLMEEYRGHNITQVLERAANTMHQILFSCNKKFPGKAKQACCYESTFQKTFRVP